MDTLTTICPTSCAPFRVYVRLPLKKGYEFASTNPTCFVHSRQKQGASRCLCPLQTVYPAPQHHLSAKDSIACYSACVPINQIDARNVETLTKKRVLEKLAKVDFSSYSCSLRQATRNGTCQFVLGVHVLCPGLLLEQYSVFWQC